MITICKFYSSRSKPKRRYTILSETKVKRHYTYYTDQERNIVILTRPPSPPPPHTHTHTNTRTRICSSRQCCGKYSLSMKTDFFNLLLN